MSRPRCSVYLALSADGFIAGPDGDVSWLNAFDPPADGSDYGFTDFFASIDTMVLGRKSYETVLGFDAPWPYAGKRCVVWTRSPDRESVHGERFSNAAPRALLREIEAEGAARVYVDGGETARAFLAGGLVDDLTFTIMPVLLGSGIPLFQSGGIAHALSLDGSDAWDNGCVQLRYRVRH